MANIERIAAAANAVKEARLRFELSQKALAAAEAEHEDASAAWHSASRHFAQAAKVEFGLASMLG